MTQPFIFRCQGHCNDERSALTFQHTDWTALLAEARILNGGRHCIYDGSYYAGGRHIVRRLKFVDGNDLWLVHIPIITASSSSDQNGISKWWTATRQFTMESEIATMIHYTEAGASVPKIFGYNTSVDGNPVRLPYMIMYCIPGNMLYNLGGFDVLTMEQKIKIRKSIASIQVCNSYSLLTCF
jgi:hypothetical protein